MKIATLISVLLFLLSSAANSFAKNEAEPTAPSFSPSPYGGSGLIHLSKAETSPNNKYFLTLQYVKKM